MCEGKCKVHMGSGVRACVGTGVRVGGRVGVGQVRGQALKQVRLNQMIGVRPLREGVGAGVVAGVEAGVRSKYASRSVGRYDVGGQMGQYPGCE